jgi:hypothetical protein
MRGAIPPLPQYAFMAWCSVKKSQGHVYLYLYLYLCGHSIGIVKVLIWKTQLSDDILPCDITSGAHFTNERAILSIRYSVRLIYIWKMCDRIEPA